MSKLSLLLFALVACANIQAEELVPLPPHPEGLSWPTEEWPIGELPSDIDNPAFDRAIDDLFSVKAENGVPDTRAILIVKEGKVIFEKYAPDFDQSTRFHSWSVAKSFTNAIIGMLVQQGKLELDQSAPIPTWENDIRVKVTIRHMLNMTSGVDNSDGADDNFLGDALFGSGALDVNRAVARPPLIHDPGKHWAYSTATSNLLAHIAGNEMGDDRESRHSYVKKYLLSVIGADNVILSYDKAGYFMGGSHVYATARDYARLGYLYLRDGVWQGQRILPEGWVDFSRTAAPADNNGNHGAHFWLSKDGEGWQPNMLPNGVQSAFIMSGNAGQYVYILPTHDMLVVRLGEKHVFSWGDLSAALAALVAVFPAEVTEGAAQ